MTTMVLRCCVCGDKEKTEEDLQVHITVRHVRYIPFECHQCPHVFLPTLCSLRRHYVKVHPEHLPVTTAIYAYDEEKEAKVTRLVDLSRTGAKFKALVEPPQRSLRHIGRTTEYDEDDPQSSGAIVDEEIESTANEETSQDDINDEMNKRLVFEVDDDNEIGEIHHELEEDEVARVAEFVNSYESIINLKHEVRDDERNDSDSPDADTATPAIELDESHNKEPSEQSPHETSTAASSRSGKRRRATEFCLLCMKTVSSNKSQHIWGNHMSTERFQCHLCDYTTAYVNKIQPHMAAKHPNAVGEYVDRRQMLKDEYEQSKLRAFGETPDGDTSMQSSVDGCTGQITDGPALSLEDLRAKTPSSSRKRPASRTPQKEPTAKRVMPMPAEDEEGVLMNDEHLSGTMHRRRSGPKSLSTTCALCGKTSFKKSNAKDVHVWRDHMPSLRYSCQLCQVQLARSDKIQMHVNRYHPGETDVIEDIKPQLAEQFALMRQKAFIKEDD